MEGGAGTLVICNVDILSGGVLTPRLNVSPKTRHSFAARCLIKNKQFSKFYEFWSCRWEFYICVSKGLGETKPILWRRE